VTYTFISSCAVERVWIYLDDVYFVHFGDLYSLVKPAVCLCVCHLSNTCIGLVLLALEVFAEFYMLVHHDHKKITPLCNKLLRVECNKIRVTGSRMNSE